MALPLVAALRSDNRRSKQHRITLQQRPAGVDPTFQSGDGAATVEVENTLTADMASEKTIATEIYMFGRLSADGRLRQVDQITRDVSPGR
jgi:hypothetical protein